jgi:ABC-type antimicrobial peptide transport system permease subunit
LPLLPLIRTLPAGAALLDPLSLAGASTVLLMVATAACLVPALRAARVDPLIVLKCE